MTNKHKPVMTKEIIEGLKIKPDGIYVDATFGGGGHTKAILGKLNSKGRVLVIDKDPAAIAIAKDMQLKDQRLSVYMGTYANILKFCEQEGVIAKVNGVVLDLGVSSCQLDQAQRGFSFMQDGPLDMRMNPEEGEPASKWLEKASESEIFEVLKVYGEERYAKRITAAIVHARDGKPITTTKELADIITAIYPKKHLLKKHPATRSFQGIRIFINNELEDLKQTLDPIISILAPKGRLVVISFHSLEDRIIKQFINKEAKGDNLPSKLPIKAKDLRPRLCKIGKAKRPEDIEVMQNVRARSAILRVAEKLAIEPCEVG